MSYTFSVNLLPATGAEAMYNLKELLKSVGWLVKSSSDGTTYNSTGDQITTGSSGAGGMANNSAWFRIQCPTMGGVTRELCIQRGTTNLVWKIKYSYSAGFTGGSPGATRVPSATDEGVLIGAGTDASPTFTSIYGTDASYRLQLAAGSLSEGYTFYSIGYAFTNSPATSPSHFVFMERLVAGTFNSNDLDGYVCYAGNSFTNLLVETDPGGPKCWFNKGGSNEVYQTAPMTSLTITGTSASLEGALGPNPFTNEDMILPVYYGHLSTTNGGYAAGIKGQGEMIQFTSTNRGNAVPFGATKNKINFQNILLPWNGQGAML